MERWRLASLSERGGAQSHFIDLCDMLGYPHPAAADGVGERFTFEKPVSKVYGGYGFADVWLRDHFAWEYKESRHKKHKDLKAAYKQLNDYREALGNPPLLVVCNLDRFEVHTNYTSTQKRVYEFDLGDLGRNQITAKCPLPPLEVLRSLFDNTDALRPNRTDAHVTQEAARVFSRLAERLEIEKRSGTDAPVHTKQEIAHFLMRVLFCLFADSIGLLPDHLFRNLIQSDDRFYPKKFLRKLKHLFDAMSQRDGIFGEHSIRYFNGGLFDSSSIIELDTTDLRILYEVSRNYDWAHVAPEIFGTLFERSLNAERRSLVGAHYTSAEDILLLIEPVVMRPLTERWEEVRRKILEALDSGRAQPRKTSAKSSPKAEAILASWIDELTGIRILDPACGSGNFLYLALRRMLDLWLEAHQFAVEHGLSLFLPKMVSPSQLFGIETEFYAHELASIVVWIGFLQWKHEHGIIEGREPILQVLNNIKHDDAIMRYDNSNKSPAHPNGKPYEPTWPDADFIIGNPPFLGDKKMRRELDIPTHPNYTRDLRSLYGGRVPGGADLVTYWFEKARAEIASGRAQRAGLLATNSIGMVRNRPILERIKKSGDIFMAWSDRPWMLDGASVRVSMVGFDDGSQKIRTLDGMNVAQIHSDLTAESEVARALPLRENDGLCFLGIMKGGPFDITKDDARKMLFRPLNPNGRPNGDVIKPRLGGQDITGRNRDGWIIDFGVDMSKHEAALYEWPFEYVKKHVKPLRDQNRRKRMREKWWLHGEARPGLRRAISNLSRCIVTPEVAKHRLFAWMDTNVIPDHKLHVIARDDDYFFGVLQSVAHESWTIATCSWIGVGNDPSYNSSTTFNTFPFPWPPGQEASEVEDARVALIADAARDLVDLRDKWLRPVGTSESDLGCRTLTNLYNERPAWLDHAHEALDRAVFAAYGWTYPLTRNEILHRLLLLNQERRPGSSIAPIRQRPRRKVPGIERHIERRSVQRNIAKRR